MRLLAAAVFLLQSPDGAELRSGLDTLYAGDFAVAAAYFAGLAARDSSHPAPLIFQASAYIWWAEALDSAEFERRRIDSLLVEAIRRARAGGSDAEFWLGTAFGYRARERELHGHAWGAAKDAKAMRDAYRRVLARDSSCLDCYLGLGLYNYGLARVGVLARLVAKLIGLGSGNAELGLGYMRRVAEEGNLARVEATWVLASALVREGERADERHAGFAWEAELLVRRLAERYPANPVFRRFLEDVAADPVP